MNDLIARIHDAVLGEHVLAAAATLGILALLLVLLRAPRRAAIATGLAAGVALTLLGTVVADRGPSGSLLRTRYGFPHWCATSHRDMQGTDVGSVTVHPAYFAGNAAMWCSLGVALAALLARRKRASP